MRLVDAATEQIRNREKERKKKRKMDFTALFLLMNIKAQTRLIMMATI
jgi:hypothetical protein